MIAQKLTHQMLPTTKWGGGNITSSLERSLSHGGLGVTEVPPHEPGVIHFLFSDSLGLFA